MGIQIRDPVNKAVSWPTYALSSVAHGVEGEEVVLANLELISAPRIMTHILWVSGGGGGWGGVVSQLERNKLTTFSRTEIFTEIQSAYGN